MACDDRERISAYHDDALPDAERAAVEVHLRGCPGCAAFLAGLRRVSRAFDTLDRPRWSAAAVSRLHRVGTDDRDRELAVLRMARGVAMVAAVVLAGSVSWLSADATGRSATGAAGAPPAPTPLDVLVVGAAATADGAGGDESLDATATATDPTMQLAEWVVTDLSGRSGG